MGCCGIGFEFVIGVRVVEERVTRECAVVFFGCARAVDDWVFAFRAGRLDIVAAEIDCD